MDDKRIYETPRIEDHGDLTELTAIADTGAFTDADIPAGTPAGDITLDHSTGVVVIDPDGRQAGLIRAPLVPADIAADLRTLVEAAP